MVPNEIVAIVLNLVPLSIVNDPLINRSHSSMITIALAQLCNSTNLLSLDTMGNTRTYLPPNLTANAKVRTSLGIHHCQILKFFIAPGESTPCSSLLSQPTVAAPCFCHYSVHCFGSPVWGKVLPICGECDGWHHYAAIHTRLPNSREGSSCWTRFPHILQEAPFSSA